ncbi:MAG: hypothetical protein ACMG6H_01410 [Acidobacteriota bacterium]
MNRTLVLCAAALLLIASAVLTFGDIARPKTTPTPEEGKTIFHTGLQIVPDSKVYEARLQISQATLQRIREETANTSATQNQSMTARLMHSSTRTMMAGLFMFLAVSFAGVWLARSGQRRNHKIALGLVLGMAVVGATAIIVRANAGPPGYFYWQKLPENLTKGESTRGGLDIEIVPGDGQIRLVLPMKNTKKPGEE